MSKWGGLEAQAGAANRRSLIAGKCPCVASWDKRCHACMKSCWTDASASLEIPGGGATPSGNGKFTIRPIYLVGVAIVRCQIRIVNPQKYT
jgi:hypothetical protein